MTGKKGLYAGVEMSFCVLTLISLKVPWIPKSGIARSRQLAMIFELINLTFFKAFQMAITITSRTAKTGPRSSKYLSRSPPLSRRGDYEIWLYRNHPHEGETREDLDGLFGSVWRLFRVALASPGFWRFLRNPLSEDERIDLKHTLTI